MRRIAALTLVALAACGASSCRHPAPVAPAAALPRFGVFLDAPSAATVTVTLPQSAVSIAVAPEPALALEDVARVEFISLGIGSALVLKLKPGADTAFAKLAAEQRGRRLVLVVDDRAIGAKRIDDSALAGRCEFLVEMSETELSDLAAKLNSSIAAASKRRSTVR